MKGLMLYLFPNRKQGSARRYEAAANILGCPEASAQRGLRFWASKNRSSRKSLTYYNDYVEIQKLLY